MKDELKWAVYLIGLGVAAGVGMISYVHANFASLSMVEKMDERIYEIHKEVVKKQE